LHPNPEIKEEKGESAVQYMIEKTKTNPYKRVPKGSEMSGMRYYEGQQWDRENS
jgi:hypothetical protein